MKYDGDTSSRNLSEKLTLSISLDQYSTVLYTLFLLYAKLRAIEILTEQVSLPSCLYFVR